MTEEGTETPAQRQARYKALVGGEFKDLFAADVQRIIDKRFKETRTLKETLESQAPVLERVMARYGADSVEALSAALEAETVREEEARAEARRHEEALQTRWAMEVEETQGTYPQFHWETESSDPMFQRLLDSEVPVKLAYEVLHLDEVRAQAARDAERRLIDHIRARGTRPSENGTAAQNAVAVKPDVSRLTRQQRRDIAQKAMRGETITLR